MFHNHTLTPRENEILLLVINEFTSTEIARKLELSVRTVETHRKNIARKTSSQNLIGLIKYAIRAGLVEGFFHRGGTSSVLRPIPRTT